MPKTSEPQGKYVSIWIADILVDGEWSPDQEMINSINQVGQLKPILVYEQDDKTMPFVLADGRRRLVAMNHLGLTEIDAKIIEPLLGVAVATLAGNLHSSNPLSEARAIKEIGDLEEVRRISGLGKSQAEARLKLLKLAAKYQTMLEQGKISLSAARALAKLNVKQQHKVWSRSLKVIGKTKSGEQKRPSAKVVSIEVKRVLGEIQPQLPVAMPDYSDSVEVLNPPALAVVVIQVAESFHESLEAKDLQILIHAADILAKLS